MQETLHAAGRAQSKLIGTTDGAGSADRAELTIENWSQSNG
jgi:hypothetical protein